MYRIFNKKGVLFWICFLSATAAMISCVLFLGVPLEPLPSGMTELWNTEAAAGDAQGWTVYVRENGMTRELQYEGYGYFSGCSRTGQTFFAEHVLDTAYSDALIELNTGSPVAVYVGDELVYTDSQAVPRAPQFLELEPVGTSRVGPVRFSLPSDYLGRSLTIAQVCISEKPEDGSVPDAYLGSVLLYDAQWYRSNVTGQALRTGYPAIVLCVIGFLLLIFFAASAKERRPDISLAFLSAFVLLWMVDMYLRSDALQMYYTSMDPFGEAVYFGSLVFLDLFMAAHMKHFRKLLYILCGVLAAEATLYAAELASGIRIQYSLLTWMAFGIQITTVVLAFVEANEKNEFYVLFAKLFIGACALFAGAVVFLMLRGSETINLIISQIRLTLLGSAPGYLLYLGRMLLIGVCAVSAVADFIRQMVRRRTDAALMEERSKMTEKSAEQLRAYARQTTVLQHDIRGHLSTIGLHLQSGRPDKALAYLKEIGAGVAALPTIVDTGNDTVDLLLNAKLGEAKDKGIQVYAVAEKLPEQLPLTETETVAVLMNTLDNAMRAAQQTENPRMMVRIYRRGGFLCYTCTNSSHNPAADPPRPQHGYGLKIVKAVVDRHEAVMETSYSDGVFELNCLFPMRIKVPHEAASPDLSSE